MKNIKVFLHGSATINNAALVGALAGASELFLVTTSGIHSNLSNQGVMCSSGAGAFNIACNVNGTTTMNNDCGILMDARGITPYINGGAYYVTGKLDIVKANTAVDVWHTLDSSNWQNRADYGGVYSAARGSITVSGQTNIITDEYLGPGAGYQTVFKDFVQGITEDQYGIIGSMYDVDTSFWVTPWVLTDHLDHPSMLRAMPHYMAIEDRETIPSILGDVKLLTVNYPVFLEIAYIDNGDGTDSFVYTVLDTSYSSITDGVVISLTYPFPVRGETAIIFDGEEIASDDQLSYLLGDPIWFDEPSPLSFVIYWTPVPNAESYEITYEYGTSGKIVVRSDISTNRSFMQNLTPETYYLMRVYSKETGGSYTEAYTTTALTIGNVAVNYNKFVTEVQDDTTGLFDLSGLETAKFGLMEDIVQAFFPDKAVIKINATDGGVVQELTTTLVHRESTIDATTTDAILTSFNPTEEDQFIEIASDALGNTKRLDYAPTNNTFAFDGVTYNVGDSIEVIGENIMLLDD